MKLKNLLSGSPISEPCAVGLGAFDGVHLGHQKLVTELLAFAKGNDIPAVIFTFDRSPRCLLNPESFCGELTTPEEKFAILLSMGIDLVVFRPFDMEFALMSPDRFVKEIIIDQFHARCVFAGFNFGFGAGREGSVTFLKETLKQSGRDCRIVSPVKFGDTLVSSTAIRKAISKGDLATANALLGREASFTGVVVHGDRRGRELGFPTANLSLERTTKILPPNGVYLCTTDTNLGTFNAIVNIGTRPTFSRDALILEAHLLDFDGDLYGTTIRVRFIERIREEKRFNTAEELSHQIRSDLSAAISAIKNKRTTF